jgi:uncharacterized protein DUF6893
VSFKNLLGGLAFIVAIVVVVAAIPDVKRYIRISTM